jgi:hypothetical protein
LFRHLLLFDPLDYLVLNHRLAPEPIPLTAQFLSS